VGQGSVGAFEKSITGSGVRVQLKAKRFRTTTFLQKRKIELRDYKGLFCSLCGKGENYKSRILYNSEKISYITLSSSRNRKGIQGKGYISSYVIEHQPVNMIVTILQ